MRLFPRLATVAVTGLLTALAFAGCADNEGAGGKMDGAMAPAAQGGPMDKDKMDGGAIDKGKTEGGAMDKGKMEGGTMDKGKMEGGAMDKGKMEGSPK